MCTLDFEVEALEFVSLLPSFTSSRLVHFFQTSDFSPHFCPLDLDSFDLTLQVGQLVSLVCVLVTLLNSFVAEAACFKVLLIEHSLRSGELVIQIEVCLGPSNTD